MSDFIFPSTRNNVRLDRLTFTVEEIFEGSSAQWQSITILQQKTSALEKEFVKQVEIIKNQSLELQGLRKFRDSVVFHLDRFYLKQLNIRSHLGKLTNRVKSFDAEIENLASEFKKLSIKQKFKKGKKFNATNKRFRI